MSIGSPGARAFGVAAPRQIPWKPKPSAERLRERPSASASAPSSWFDFYPRQRLPVARPPDNRTPHRPPDPSDRSGSQPPSPRRTQGMQLRLGAGGADTARLQQHRRPAGEPPRAVALRRALHEVLPGGRGGRVPAQAGGAAGPGALRLEAVDGRDVEPALPRVAPRSSRGWRAHLGDRGVHHDVVRPRFLAGHLVCVWGPFPVGLFIGFPPALPTPIRYKLCCSPSGRPKAPSWPLKPPSRTGFAASPLLWVCPGG